MPISRKIPQQQAISRVIKEGARTYRLSHTNLTPISEDPSIDTKKKSKLSRWLGKIFHNSK